MVGLRLAVILLLSPALFGQSGAGSIQGVVRDSSHAVIPGAKVSTQHTTTSIERKTTANELGFFVIPGLQPGPYKVTVEAAGMQKWDGELILQVGQTAELAPVLAVGSVSTTTTVVGDVTPLVTTTGSTLGTVIERERVEQLPLNGRFMQDLVLFTTPGLEVGVNGGSGNPNVYGLRTAMEFVQDGAVLANRDQGGITARPPGMDTIEEFRVETNNSSARLSRPATTIVSTKSGTNRLHGSLFETNRNNGMGVARRRQDFFTTAPHLVRNEFGGSAGGPVFLPKIYDGRNRTFFFFGYEDYRLVSLAPVTAYVPLPAMNQGDFSGLVDGNGRRYQLYDPWTSDAKGLRTPYPNNQIPITQESPMAKYMLGVTPAPTLPNVNPLVSPNYFAPGPNNTFDHTYTLRMDHRFSDRDQVFVRYNAGNQNYTFMQDNSVPLTTDGRMNFTYEPVHDNNAVLSWTHTFSPTFFSEALLTGSQEDWDFAGTAPGSPNLTDQLGLPIAIAGRQLASAVYSSGFGNSSQYYVDPGRENVTRILTFEENLTKIHGRHEIQFGGRMRQERVDVLPDQPALYHWYDSQATALYDPTSGSAYSAVPFTGSNAANFFLGIASRYSAEVIRSWYYLTQREYDFYVQDNFKLNSRLTLNFGLRNEMYPAMSERNSLLSGYDVKSGSMVLQTSLDQMYKLGASTPAIVGAMQNIGVKFTTPSAAGLPGSLYKSSWHDLNPRVGFAYRLTTGKRPIVLRGAYGVYGYSANTRSFTVTQRANPPVGTTITYNQQNPAQSPDGLPNFNLRNAPTVISGVNSRNIILDQTNLSINPGGPSVWFFDPNLPTLRAHEWNVTMERELARNTVLRLSYIGTHGSNLDQYQYLNTAPNSYVWFAGTGQPLPTGTYAATATQPLDKTTFGSINEFTHNGWSNNNSAQAEFEHRFSQGYAVQVFYLWSNAFRAGGNARYDDTLFPAEDYLPGAVPADAHARNRLLNYARDPDMPKHRIRWNWIADLPAGRGKWLAGNAGGLLNQIIGGWQLAGQGTMRTNYFALPTSNWGPVGKVEVYGKKYPIQDCRSGTCIAGYLWYNGYIPANRINSHDASGKPNGVEGVPSNYAPSSQPIFATPAGGILPGDPNAPYYESNTVFVPLANGTLQRTTLNTNYHPYRNQYVSGPFTWGLDASLFKSWRIAEKTTLRFNADFFNVLNMPGLVQPNSTSGILSLQNSANSPRQMQLTLRLVW